MPLQRNSYPAQSSVRTLGASSINRRPVSLSADVDGVDDKNIEQVVPFLVFAHRGVRGYVDNPKHGDSGWYKGKLYIYNGVHGSPGWLKLEQYQKRKAEMTRRRDWRVSEVPKSSWGEKPKERKNPFYPYVEDDL